MRSKSRKSLAVLLAGAMMMSMVVLPGMAVPAAAAQFNDTKGHWAETSIIRWSDNKIVQGSDGKFNPDAFMTRAEMATILTNLLVLQETAKNSFADVAPGSWYESAVLKCAAAGIMKGDGTNANPNGTITREEATTMLGRALAIAPSTGDLTFTDKATVADYAKGYVKAMNEKGIIKGISAGVFGAKSSITRASVATILDRAITTYANKKDATVTAKDKGITLVAAPGVTVTGTVEDLLIAQGASSATTSLKDAKVTGTATVNAAKANIKMIGTSSVNQFTVSANASGVALDLDKTAKITSLTTAADTLAVSGTGTIAKMTVTAGKDVTVAKETTVTQLENKGKNDVKYGDKIVKGDGTAEQPSIGGGGGGGGGGDTVSEGFKTLAELVTAASKNADITTLTVDSVNHTILATDDAIIQVAAAKTLTIDLATVTARDITINAPTATTINLNGKATVQNLTINAPNATVKNNWKVTGKVTIEAVANNSFHQLAEAAAFLMKGQGKLEMGRNVGEPTVTIDTTAPVTLAGEKMGAVTITAPSAKVIVTGNTPSITSNASGAEVTVATANPVAFSGTIEKVDVTTPNSGVTVTAGATVKEAKATAATTFGGDGAITNVEANAATTVTTKMVATVTATQAVTLNTPVMRVTVPAGSQSASVAGTGKVQEIAASAPVSITNKAVAKVSVPANADAGTTITATDVNIPLVEIKSNVSFAGSGTFDAVDVNARSGDSIEVSVTDTATVSEVANTGNGGVTTTKDTIGATIPQMITTKAAPPDSDLITFSKYTAVGGNGTIGIASSLANSTLQYSADNAIWTDVRNNTSIPVTAGTYYVRAIGDPASGVCASAPIFGTITQAIGLETPTISGTAIVGQTLTAHANGDANGVITYQWKADRSSIADATGQTFTLTDAQFGKEITVTMTNHKQDKTSAATSAVIADKTALNNAIDAATAAKTGITISDKAKTEIPEGVRFVRNTDMNGLVQAITTATTAAGNGLLNTAKVEQALAALNRAVVAFNTAKDTGTLTEVGKIKPELNKALAAANALYTDGTKVAADSSTVAPATLWVTRASKDAYKVVIDRADLVSKNANVTATDLSKAINDLNMATKVFQASKRNGMTIDTTALQAAITAAEANVATVTVNTDAGNVEQTEKWVRTKAMADYATTAIPAAKTALTTPATQSVVINAMEKLDTATKEFNAAKEVGTKGDASALKTAVSNAEANLASTLTASDPTTVAVNQLYVSQTVKNTYTTAIGTAKVYTGNQAALDGRLTTLKVATTAFNNAKKMGTKIEKATISKIINKAITDINVKMAYAEISALDGNGAATITIKNDKTFVSTVYGDIGITLQKTLAQHSGIVNTVKIGNAAPLDITKPITPEVLKNLVQTSGLTGANGAIKGNDPINLLKGQTLTITVTDKNNAPHTYTIVFA